MKLKTTPCPKCNRKGLHHPDIWGHGKGYQDPTIVVCRFCNAKFYTQRLEAWLAEQNNQIVEGTSD